MMIQIPKRRPWLVLLELAGCFIQWHSMFCGPTSMDSHRYSFAYQRKRLAHTYLRYVFLCTDMHSQCTFFLFSPQIYQCLILLGHCTKWSGTLFNRMPLVCGICLSLIPFNLWTYLLFLHFAAHLTRTRCSRIYDRSPGIIIDPKRWHFYDIYAPRS